MPAIDSSEPQSDYTGIVPVTVIILTFNEQDNIDHALRSVLGWAQAIFVVDSFSTDETVATALRYQSQGVTVVQHAFENYSRQWNWAVEQLPIRTPWVLKLDADERATPAFREEVRSRLCSPDLEEVAFVVHWHLYFMGRRLTWGGLYPNGNVRIWRHGCGHFGDREANEHVVVAGPVGTIQNPIEHHDYKSLTLWIDRHNRYSSMEAREVLRGNLTGDTAPRLWGRPEERRMWLRQLYYRLPVRPLLYFVYRYFVKFGLFDGRVGFRYIFLHSVFFYWIDLKLLESRQTGQLPTVMWPARGTSHPQLRQDGG